VLHVHSRLKLVLLGLVSGLGLRALAFLHSLFLASLPLASVFLAWYVASDMRRRRLQGLGNSNRANYKPRAPGPPSTLR